MEPMIAGEQPSKKRVSRATTRPVATKTKKAGEKKIKIGLLVSEEAAQRLGLWSLMSGEDRSDLVTKLILDHLKGWVVQWRGPDSPTESLSVSES